MKLSRYIQVAIFSSFCLISCQNNRKDYNDSPNSKVNKEESPKELRKELVDKERESPKDYLQAQAGWRKNLIGETVVEGTINNTATLAKFKDVELKIIWLTKTNTELGTESKIIYDFFKPGESRPFKFKFNAPADMGGFNYEVVSATPVN